jgi:hypothetical protein
MRKIDLARLVRTNLRGARQRWGSALTPPAVETLKAFTEQFLFVISAGDLLLMDRGWHVTNTGLLRLARRRRCKGIQVEPVEKFSAPSLDRFVFKATVFRSDSAFGFVGFGDADPSNVSGLVRGAEMRVAETRAVLRIA